VLAGWRRDDRTRRLGDVQSPLTSCPLAARTTRSVQRAMGCAAIGVWCFVNGVEFAKANVCLRAQRRGCACSVSATGPSLSM
jgi:hypothetical protein